MTRGRLENRTSLMLLTAMLALVGACTFEITVEDDDEPAGVTSDDDDDDAGIWPTDIDPGSRHERAVAIVAGRAHACAASESGAVSCWGANDHGQLGYGHTGAIGDDETPDVAGPVDVGEPVVALAAGGQHTCAILAGGRIRCWGYGGDLALGRGNSHDETIGDDETPAEGGDAIIYGSSPFVQLAAGDRHSCMLDEAGLIKCWGTSEAGALGYGWATSTGGWLGTVPVGDDARRVVAGGEHTCALTMQGAVRCWGHAAALGHGAAEHIGDDEIASQGGVVALSEPVMQLAAGYRHTCALTTHGAVRCWGAGEHGVLGYGDEQWVAHAAAAGIVQVGGVAVQLAAGRHHTCALMLNGAVRCWGDNTHGTLGYGHTETIGDDETPASAGDVALSEPALKVVAGDSFTCALLQSGAVQCWGLGDDGRLGQGHEQHIGDDELPSATSPMHLFPR